MQRDLRRVASVAAAAILAVGLGVSPVGAPLASADSGLSITGNVVGSAGHLGGVVVDACTTDWNFCTDTVTTDASGSFALTGLEPGDYYVQFDGTPTYQAGWYAGPGLTQDFDEFTPVTAPATLTDVELAVAYKISGTLTGADGGLSKLHVTVCSDQYGCFDGAVDDDGNFVVAGLSPDTYTLSVSNSNGVFLDGGSPYVFGWDDGTSVTPDQDAALSIPVSDGDVTLPTFDVPIGAVLTGSLSGSNGSLANVDVDACSITYGSCADSFAGDDGQFSISGLWPDDYIVFVDGRDDYLSGYYTPDGLVQDRDDSTPVTVVQDGTDLPTIALQPAWKIQGTVTGVAGHLGGVFVQACADMYTCGATETEDDGTFSVGGLAPGSYMVEFDDWTGYFASGYYSDSGVTVPDADQATLVQVPPSVSGLTVELTYSGTAAAPDAPLDVTATPGDGSATVSWTAPNDNGSAITTYTVTGSDGSTCASATTTCTVTGLTNGTAYTFTVTATNSIGESDPSAPSDPVTPTGPAQVGAVKLGISAASHTAVAGADVSVTISALNKNGKVNPGYTGTVQLSSTDPRAVLPDAYTFTAADAGVHTFTLSLETAGAQSISATDSTLASRKWAISVKPGAAASLVLTGPETATAGTAAHFKVMAIDAFGNVATADTDSLSIASTDPSFSVSPASPALAHGKRALSVTFRTAGTQTIQVTDAANPDLVATFDGIVVAPARAASISITGLPDPTTAGAAAAVTATVLDRFGNVVTGYAGTVHFSTNDRAAVLPADYTFTAGDAGSHTFTVTLNTAGNRWITLRDTVKHSVGGRARATVVAAP